MCSWECVCLPAYGERAKWIQGMHFGYFMQHSGMKTNVYKRTHWNPWYLLVRSLHCQTVKECLNMNTLYLPWMKFPLWCVITGCVLGSSKFEWVFHCSLMGFSSPLGTHDAVNNSFQMPEVYPRQQPTAGCTNDGHTAFTQNSILGRLVWFIYLVFVTCRGSHIIYI